LLWDCEHCKCQGIADSLSFCPVCSAARPDPDPGTPSEAVAAPEAEAEETPDEAPETVAEAEDEPKLPKGWKKE
jgi:hypothetical protein